MSGLFLRTGARDRTGRRASVAPRGRPHPCAAAVRGVQSCHVDSSYVEGDVDAAFVLGLAGFLGSLSAYAERHRELFASRLFRESARTDKTRARYLWQYWYGALVLFFVLCLPSFAFAADGNGVVWGPQSLGSGVGGGNGVVVLASNRFSAAAVALGYNPNDHQTFTDEVKTKLSNESSGGAFYSFVQLFQAAFPDGSASASSPTNYPEWGGRDGMDALFITYGEIYGYSRVFWGQYTSAQRASAIEDLQTVLRGGSLGGGGGGVGDGEYVTFTTKVRYVNYSSWAFKITANGVTYTSYPKDVADKGYTLLPQTLTLRIPKSVFGTDGEYLQGATSVVVKAVSVTTSSSGTFLNVNSTGTLVCYGSAAPHEDSFSFSQGGTQYTGTWYDSYALSSGTYRTIGTVSGGLACTFDGSTITVTRDTPVSFNSLITNNPTYSFTTGTAAQLFVSGASSGGGNLTNNWPHDVITGHPMDEPAVPTPPVYDPITYTNPGDDPIPTPTPITYTVGENPTNTSPNDYTPWLEAILNELKAIHRDMVGLGNSMRSEFRSVMNTFWSNLKAQLRAGFQAVLSGLDQNAQEVMDYMQDLAEWLVDQLDFTFTAPGYDDSSLISWIKKIWARQGTGDINSRPVDPSSNPSGQWVWTTGVTQGLLSGLNDTASGVVTTVSSAVAGLTGKFPLSVPWDIYRVMQEFSGTAVTPYVDLTLPTGIGNNSYHLVIDLSPYDSMMAVVRQVELVAFGAFLAWSTKDLLAAVNMSGIVS